MNQNIYIYKITFIAFFILILFDIAGCVKNMQSFLLAFCAILFIIHGIYIINFFSIIKKGFCMSFLWFSKIFYLFIGFFHKKTKKTNKKKSINTLAIKKNKTPLKKKIIKKK